ncbi:MAG TPA: hypothetical protein VMF32_21435 [Xanthobacteraceae bacterium]|nr:hypothetical protein [Xanthobacteraceae bacterium]
MATTLESVPTAVVKAVSDAAKVPAEQVPGKLLDLLGATLTAAIGGAQAARAAREWAEGRRCNRADALKAALQASAAISTSYGAESARSWFTSTNPDLDWTSPLVFVRAANEPADYDRLVQVAAQDAR